MSPLSRMFLLITTRITRFPRFPAYKLLPGIVAAVLCLVLAISNGGSLEGGHMIIAFALALILQSNMTLYIMSLNTTHVFGSWKHWVIAVAGQIGLLWLLLNLADFTWCQHAITLAAIFAAVRCVPGMMQTDEEIARRRWSQSEFSGFRPQLCAGLFLLFSAYAVMNEILIKTLSSQDWLILWMFLPVIHFYAAVILIDTIMLSTRRNA